jgi:predicted esterase
MHGSCTGRQLGASTWTYRLPLCRVVVAGFSQGGAVALLMLRSDVKVAGVAGLSTWLTLADEPPLSAANAATPLWMAHGTADPVVRSLAFQHFRLAIAGGSRIC